MSRIPARLNKIAAAFNEAAKAPRHLCHSSGSEHSQSLEDSTDLSDLVNSFFERDCKVETDDEGKIHQEEEEEQDESNGYWSESETKHMLRSLLSKANDGTEEEDVKQKICRETELACGVIEDDMSSEDFKRLLTSHLRHKGFDAGLCKSRWEKLGLQAPIAGNYEYVDVNVNGTRYIVEVNLAGEFEIARPTTSYTSLLEVFPPIFVGKSKDIKKVVKLMCKAMRESIESRDMHMPPWRRSGYMQSKWFGRYRRTLNKVPSPSRNVSASQFNDSSVAKTPVGFEAISTISFQCRDNFASKSGLKFGHLAAAFNGTS